MRGEAAAAERGLAYKRSRDHHRHLRARNLLAPSHPITGSRARPCNYREAFFQKYTPAAAAAVLHVLCILYTPPTRTGFHYIADHKRRLQVAAAAAAARFLSRVSPRRCFGAKKKKQKKNSFFFPSRGYFGYFAGIRGFKTDRTSLCLVFIHKLSAPAVLLLVRFSFLRYPFIMFCYVVLLDFEGCAI